MILYSCLLLLGPMLAAELPATPTANASPAPPVIAPAANVPTGNKVTLVEELGEKDQTAVVIRLGIQGKIQLGKEEHQLSGQALLNYHERVIKLGGDKLPDQLVRHYQNTWMKFTVSGVDEKRELRPERSFLLGKHDMRTLTMWCPTGPLSREECELVEDNLDISRLAGLLPKDAVAEGDSWLPPDFILQAVCDLEYFVDSDVKCTLEKLDEANASIAVEGTVSGLNLSSEMKIKLDSKLTFSRQSRLITDVQWTQTETRTQGPANPAGSYGIRLAISRDRRTSTDLSDEQLLGLQTEPTESARLLIFEHPEQKYRFFYGRHWHLTALRPEVVVFRCMKNSEFLAQVNITTLQPRGNKSPMPAAELQKMLLDSAEYHLETVARVDQVPLQRKDIHVQLVAGQGKIESLDLAQRHYLITGPAGQQVLCGFFFEPRYEEKLDQLDLQIVSSIEFFATASAADDSTVR